MGQTHQAQRFRVPWETAGVVTIAFAAACGSAARAPADEITFYQELAWSPDGSRIAYSAMKVSRGRWDKERYGALSGGDYEVYVMSSDGSDRRRLTTNPEYDLWLSWALDGRRLVFGSDRGGNTDLHLMNADGSDLTRLTHDVGEESGPDWSPDGSRIAFMSKQDAHWQLWVMAPDGTGRRQLTTAARDHSNPIWSPDGSTVTYYTRPDWVFVLDVDSAGPGRALVPGIFPEWSPDGKTLLYGSEHQLFRVGRDGGNPQLVAEKSEFGRFSPDGKRIALVMGDFPDTQIYVMEVDGSKRQQHTK